MTTHGSEIPHNSGSTVSEEEPEYKVGCATRTTTNDNDEEEPEYQVERPTRTTTNENDGLGEEEPEYVVGCNTRTATNENDGEEEPEYKVECPTSTTTDDNGGEEEPEYQVEFATLLDTRLKENQNDGPTTTSETTTLPRPTPVRAHVSDSEILREAKNLVAFPSSRRKSETSAGSAGAAGGAAQHQGHMMEPSLRVQSSEERNTDSNSGQKKRYWAKKEDKRPHPPPRGQAKFSKLLALRRPMTIVHNQSNDGPTSKNLTDSPPGERKRHKLPEMLHWHYIHPHHHHHHDRHIRSHNNQEMSSPPRGEIKRGKLANVLHENKNKTDDVSMEECDSIVVNVEEENDAGQRQEQECHPESVVRSSNERQQGQPGVAASPSNSTQSSDDGHSQEGEGDEETPTTNPFITHFEEHNLVVAHEVADEGDMDLPRADEVTDPSSLGKHNPKQISRRAIVSIGFCCLIVLVGIVLLFVFLLPEEQDCCARAAPGMIGEQSDLSPAAVYVRGLLPNFTIDALQDTDSPQYKAFDWLLNDPFLSTYYSDRQRILQRFSLATIWYGTDGYNWKMSNNNWLDYSVHECKWSVFSYKSASIWLLSIQSIYGDIYPKPGLVLTHSPEEDKPAPWSSNNDMYPIAYKEEYEHSNPCEEEDIDNIVDGTFKHLWLINFGLYGTLPPEVSFLTTLRTLAVWANPAYGTLPVQIFQKLTNLEALTISATDVSGAIPRQIANLSALRFFSLIGNRFSGTLPTELGELSQLLYISVDNNRFEGAVPSELGKLSGLKWLFLFSNELSGTIPSELSRLTSAIILGLDRLSLNGMIPSSLGQLSQLRYLWLNKNKLTGRVPSELGLMTSMRSMDLSNNSLTGKVPEEVLKLQTRLVLFGNDKLIV